MLKAIIFDMDGLLIDSEPLWQEAEIEIFKQVNIPLNRKLCQQTTGLRIDEVVDYWYHKFPWKTVTKEQIIERIMVKVIQLIRQKGEPKEGVKEILTFLKRQNIPLALASSSHYNLIDVVLDKLQIRDAFEVIYSATEEEYGKPHPAVYLKTAKQLKVLPQECLVLEDSLNGVIAAKAARMKCIAIPEIFPDYNPKYIIADFVLKSLTEIKEDLWIRISNI